MPPFDASMNENRWDFSLPRGGILGAVLRPSGSLLASSRAAQRRTVVREASRLAYSTARKVAAALTDVLGAALDVVVMVGLPILYAASAYLTLDLPARLFAGRVHFSAVGFLFFLAAVGVSLLGLSRALREATPVAPVRPKFARAMLLAGWAAALLLTVADLAG